MGSGRDWRAEEVPTTQLPDLTEVATGRLPDLPGAEPLPPAPTALVMRPGLPASPVEKTSERKAERQVARSLPKAISRRDATQVRRIQEECRKVCLALFFREPVATRSLGFTSALAGEGKSFLSMVTAGVLAADTVEPVVLVECNWEHPVLHEFFDVPSQPGLAEWLRQECGEVEIRHRVGPNLIVIPAGEGARDPVRLLQRLREKSAAGVFSDRPERYIFDLPPVISAAYGELAAGIVESVIVVVRSGVTPDSVVADACARLKDLPVEGIVLNQVESQIPQWIQRML
jgi:protein-tyrosine kinase